MLLHTTSQGPEMSRSSAVESHCRLSIALLLQICVQLNAALLTNASSDAGGVHKLPLFVRFVVKLRACMIQYNGQTGRMHPRSHRPWSGW